MQWAGGTAARAASRVCLSRTSAAPRASCTDPCGSDARRDPCTDSAAARSSDSRPRPYRPSPIRARAARPIARGGDRRAAADSRDTCRSCASIVRDRTTRAASGIRARRARTEAARAISALSSGGDALVGVERKNPVVRGQGRGVILLIDVAVPGTHVDALGELARDGDGVVRAFRIDDDNLVGPGKGLAARRRSRRPRSW